MDKKTYLLIDNVRSLYNIGSLFRIADATGVKKVYLSGYSGIEMINGKAFLHPKINKTALEGINVTWEYIENPICFINQLKKEKVNIYTLELTDSSVDYINVKYRFPLCLIVGHERNGVSNNLIKLADKIIKVPMHGKGKSLNVAIASAVTLYKINENG